MAPPMTFRDLLQREAESFFWIRSNNVFRLSTSFSEIIYQYLVRLESSHQNNRVHQWENTRIQRNLRFIQGDHQRISFHKGPVEASDFDTQRQQDYRDLATFIEYVHHFYELPDITDDNCNELVRFLRILNNPAGQELWIKKHYCLWDFHKRFQFYKKLHNRYRQDEFKIYFDNALHQYLNWGETLHSLYPGDDGFGEAFNDEPLLRAVYDFGDSDYSGNTYPDLFRYARNLGAHYSASRMGNPHTEREAEWLFHKKFPDLLMGLCEILMGLNIYFQFA